MYSVNINDIYFFEKFERKIEIVLKDKRISFYGSFISLEKMLDERIFIKCHKSYIVNISKILTIYKDEITFKDITNLIYISNNYKNILMNKIINIR